MDGVVLSEVWERAPPRRANLLRNVADGYQESAFSELRCARERYFAMQPQHSKGDETLAAWIPIREELHRSERRCDAE